MPIRFPVRLLRKRYVTRLAAGSLLVTFAVTVGLGAGGTPTALVIDDVGSVLVTAWAAVASAMAARRLRGREAGSWALLAAGAAAWSAGETAWAYQELVEGVPFPFPSVADIGYLLWPVLAGAGLLVRPAAGLAGRLRVRTALDALVVALSLFAVSWAVVLGPVVGRSGNSTLATVISLAYPVSDVAMLAVLIVLARSPGGIGRGGGWVALGIGTMSVADSVFAYASAAGTYETGRWLDVVWIAGLLAVAEGAARARPGTAASCPARVSSLAVVLPYAPLAAAVSVSAAVEVWADGDTTLVVVTAIATVLLVVRHVVVQFDHRALRDVLTHRSSHDQVTGLPNRHALTAELERVVARHRAGDGDLGDLGLIVLGLDDFDEIVDGLGRSAGDELLAAVAHRLPTAVRAGDLVARVDGDAFAVLLGTGAEVAQIGRRVLRCLAAPVVVAGRTVPVAVSVGTVTVPAGGSTPSAEEVLRRADVARHAAQHLGHGAVRAFDQSLDEHRDLGAHFDLRAALVADVRAGRIDVAFQPIDTRGGRYGVEALARWRTGDAWIPPSVFVALAERAGVAVDLDLLVLERSVAVAADDPELVLSVNVCLATLRAADVVDVVADVLARYRFPAHRLTVEVLESGLVEEDDTALTHLEQIRALGVRISVDDFGTGYSSFARVVVLRPDVVKLDRSLVRSDRDSRVQDVALLQGVTAFAHRLGASVVAEGIETDDQLTAAHDAGCDAFQGYLIGRPRLLDRAEVPAVAQLLAPAPVGLADRTQAS